MRKMFIASSEQMRELDRTAIEEFVIPGIVLMENAGRGTVRCFLEAAEFSSENNILIVCGKGNNGGDGFVVARHLWNAGFTVSVLLLSRLVGVGVLPACAGLGLSAGECTAARRGPPLPAEHALRDFVDGSWLIVNWIGRQVDVLSGCSSRCHIGIGAGNATLCALESRRIAGLLHIHPQQPDDPTTQQPNNPTTRPASTSDH